MNTLALKGFSGLKNIAKFGLAWTINFYNSIQSTYGYVKILSLEASSAKW